MKYEHIGTLRHNDSDRYELGEGYYFTSGDSIEIFIDEEDRWLKGRIEYSQHYQDYYFYEPNEEIYIYSLGGTKARI